MQDEEWQTETIFSLSVKIGKAGTMVGKQAVMGICTSTPANCCHIWDCRPSVAIAFVFIFFLKGKKRKPEFYVNFPAFPYWQIIQRKKQHRSNQIHMWARFGPWTITLHPVTQNLTAVISILNKLVPHGPLFLTLDERRQKLFSCGKSFYFHPR